MDPKVKKEIEEIIALFESCNLSELEVEREGIRVRLKKEVSTSFPDYSKVIATPEAEKEEEAGLVPVKTPMVGTFYRTPSPEAAPFVEVGSKVEPEQIVCIIEAMKLMNEIKAEVKGTIVKTLIEDGHPVEYGQTLFLVRPE